MKTKSRQEEKNDITNEEKSSNKGHEDLDDENTNSNFDDGSEASKLYAQSKRKKSKSTPRVIVSSRNKKSTSEGILDTSFDSSDSDDADYTMPSARNSDVSSSDSDESSSSDSDKSSSSDSDESSSSDSDESSSSDSDESSSSDSNESSSSDSDESSSSDSDESSSAVDSESSSDSIVTILGFSFKNHVSKKTKIETAMKALDYISLFIETDKENYYLIQNALPTVMEQTEKWITKRRRGCFGSFESHVGM
jgi:hypothetical protein